MRSHGLAGGEGIKVAAAAIIDSKKAEAERHRDLPAPPRALRTATRALLRLPGVDVVWLAVRESRAQAAVIRCGEGARSPAGLELAIEPGVGAGGAVLLMGEPWQGEVIKNGASRLSTKETALLTHEGAKHVMVIPLCTTGLRGEVRIEGIAYAGARRRVGWSDKTLRVAQRAGERVARAARDAQRVSEVTQRWVRMWAQLAGSGEAADLRLDRVARQIAADVRAASCRSPKPHPSANWLICRSGFVHYFSSMITLLLRLLRLLPVLLGGHRQLALENLALRQQLAVYKRMMTRPRLRRTDRLFWVWLARIWAGWRQSIVIVTPDTVLRWQRRRFREYWTQLSGRTTGGRPPTNAEIRALIARMATANPLWGAPRIHGELLKLGIDVAERTVSRHMPKRRPVPSQTWRTFLANHVRDLVAIDFFTVPTARLRVLFVFVVLAHHRRRVVHFNVTEHPTAAWTTQQIVDAFPDDFAPSYLLRDRDQVYGEQFRHRVKGMCIDEVLTAPHSPWQNPFAERLIGSIRRECLNHVLVLGERHLRRILTHYFAYYHQARTHLALDKDAPDLRPIEPPAAGKIVQRPEVGGLHHRYLRQAA